MEFYEPEPKSFLEYTYDETTPWAIFTPGNPEETEIRVMEILIICDAGGGKAMEAMTFWQRWYWRWWHGDGDTGGGDVGGGDTDGGDTRRRCDVGGVDIE